ncbi:MAG: tetraacyldisaccharide 4'-kinase [Candidatus Omnitrophota bacterium]
MHAFYAENKMTLLSFFLMPVLLLASCLYAFFLFLIKLFYHLNIFKSYRPKAIVVSVGNITMGGSGKTPLVAYLADYLSDRHKVVILLRGYKKPKTFKSLGSDGYYSSGDEAGMLIQNLGQRCKVVADKNRLRCVQVLEDQGFCGTFILDDGFQHWRLKRDFDLVVVDAANPFGNRMLLPAGPLRETLSALKRADCICLCRCNEIPSERLHDLCRLLSEKAPGTLIIKAIHESRRIWSLETREVFELDIVGNKRVGLFCGIANPHSFVKSAERLGASVVMKRFFPDHHEYSEVDMACLIKQCKDLNVSVLMTTEKDAQRLSGFFSKTQADVKIFVLKIAITIIEGQEALHERLDTLYHA